MTQDYRKDLPPRPTRIVPLPLHRGYPVPYFVAWVDDVPDFRIVDPAKLASCVHEHRCWICGDYIKRADPYAFVVGPMCAVNRVSSEPPSHQICARYAATACPFLTRPKMVRREGGLEEMAAPAGFSIERNPGVALIWLTREYRVRSVGGGVLFTMGEPIRVIAIAEGRAARPDEVRASFESGLPALREMAEQEGGRAQFVLSQQAAVARKLLGI